MNWAVIKDPTILVTAAVYGMLAFVVTRAGLFGIWLGILLLLSLWRYCYAVLRTVAQGLNRIPPPDLDSFNPVGEIMVIWHLVAFPGLILATARYQPAGSVVAVLAAFAFPASAALMGLTSNLAHAFNPSAWIAFARSLGRDYLMLVAGYVGIFVAASVMQRYVVSRIGLLSSIIGFMIETWALLASFALVGSALRAHRLEFEIPGERVPPEERDRKLRHEDWRKALDRAYASMRSGLVSSGYRTLHELVEANGDSLEVNHWLFENMLEWEDKKYALEVAIKLMPRLLALDDRAGALELYRRCRRQDQGFRLPPATAETLALHATAFGQHGLADELRHSIPMPLKRS